MLIGSCYNPIVYKSLVRAPVLPFYTSFMSMTYAYFSFTFGLRCAYGARRLPVSPLSYGLRAAIATAVRLAYNFTGSVACALL